MMFLNHSILLGTYIVLSILNERNEWIGTMELERIFFVCNYESLTSSKIA